MATRAEFCEAMNEVWKNHGVYIGTANGELTEELTVGRIREMEVNYGYDVATTNKNIRRDFAFIGKCYENGYSMRASRAGDCSGQIVGCLRRLGCISSQSDYSAKMFQELCEIVPLDQLRPGDLVFDKKMKYDDKKKKYVSSATHVGAYVGSDMCVESKGRDDGVVKRKTSEGRWVVGGRLPDKWFDDGGDIPVLTRNLYYRRDDLMRGEDVRQCQERLKIKGCDPGSIDGVFGNNTKQAVLKFQEENNDKLEVDGVVGQRTWEALWT